MLAVDSLVLVITWTPFMVLLLDPQILPPDEFTIAYVIVDVLLVANCFSTPLMFLIFNRDFQVGFHVLINHCKIEK